MQTYAVASLVSETSGFGRSITGLQRALTDSGIHYTKPKIGSHVTLVPPFFIEEDVAQWLTLGLDLACALHFDSPSNCMMHLGEFDFFESTDSLVLVRRLNSPKRFEDVVERMRSFVSRHAEWKYPPESYLVNFHITIAEDIPQEKRGQILEILGPHEAQNSVSWCHLESPRLLRKESINGQTSWPIFRM